MYIPILQEINLYAENNPIACSKPVENPRKPLARIAKIERPRTGWEGPRMGQLRAP
jgi:hypothetical protein